MRIPETSVYVPLGAFDDAVAVSFFSGGVVAVMHRRPRWRILPSFHVRSIANAFEGDSTNDGKDEERFQRVGDIALPESTFVGGATRMGS